MRFQLLGPLSITDGRDVAVLPPSKPTSLLAALLLRPGSIVSAERLRGVVWGEEHPPTAKTALQSCVLRLRRLFAKYGIENQAIVAVAGGYRVDADAETLDLLHFRRLVEHATASDPESELYTLRTALGLWQGALLANVPSDLLHRDEVPRLSEERLRVLERVCDIELEHDRCREALVDLWEVTRVYPAHERFAEQLMVALYRTGRQTEALAEYRRIKEHLRERLGVDPRAELQRLELAILRGEDLGPVDTARGPLRLGATRGPLGQGAGHGTPGPGAAHGPLSPHGAREPLPLGTASDDAPSPSAYSPAASSPHSPAGSVAPPAYPSPGPVASAVPPGGVSVSPLGPSATSGAPSAGARPSGVSTGAGGRAPSSAAASTSPLPTVPHFTGRAGEVGALEALLTADRPAEGSERLPLAVLSGAPGIGKTALALHVAHRTARHFPGGCVLVALTEPDGTPRPAEEAAAELRRALPPGSEERGPVLLVLDDVVHPDQVRPLLTAHPDGAALVTSRMGLTGLVATHGGTVHRLGALEPEQSRALLTAVLGRERFAAEPAAAHALAAACGHHPLALRIAAARLLTRPRLRVADYANWLRRDPVGRLSLADDPRMSVPQRFDEALRRLPPGLAEAHLRLAASPYEPLTAARSAEALGLPEEAAEEVVERLLDAGFLEEGQPGAFWAHDLLRAHARRTAGTSAGHVPALLRPPRHGELPQRDGIRGRLAETPPRPPALR
nr:MULTISPECIES: BTAD domain-containing putative transcriptional regulator [unclassified Streptomyces]